MRKVLVRQAVFSDIDVIVPLFDAYRQFYGKASSVSEVRRFLTDRFNHGESVIFIAYVDDVAVGLTQLYPSFSSVSLARIFVLNDLYVLEQYRGCGVATHLMNAATDYARQLNAVHLALSTAIENKTAQSLYASFGWKRDEQFFHYQYSLIP